jgi:peptidylprolyl isomerase
MIQRFAIALVGVGLLVGTAVSAQQSKAAPKAPPAPAGPVIVLETVKGPFEIETFPTDAPKSVEHVLALVRKGFYRGLRVHWAPPGLIQFGDPLSRDMTRKEAWGAGNSGKAVGVAEPSKRKFEKGIVGMAYTQDQKPTAADSQLFICRYPNPSADGKYTAIGKVITGMDVVDKLDVGDVIKVVYVKGETAK